VLRWDRRIFIEVVLQLCRWFGESGRWRPGLVWLVGIQIKVIVQVRVSLARWFVCWRFIMDSVVGLGRLAD
jgi:hypothetical protein